MFATLQKSDIEIRLDESSLIRVVLSNDVNNIYINGLNNSKMTQYLETGNTKYTSELVKEYVEKNLHDPFSILFGLFINNELQGTSRLHDIDFVNRQARIGIAIFNSSLHGNGFAPRILTAIIEYAMKTIGLNTVSAGIYNDNIASQKAFKKAGFKLMHVYPENNRQIWAIKKSQ